MRRTYFRQPRVLSRHFRAVVRNPPEGSYTQYTPVFAHRYASCTPGVFFSLSCKANPSRARRPTVTHIAFGSAAIAARASASSPAVPRSTPPPLTSARTRPGAGRSSSASAHAVPNVTVTFPSCGAGVAEDAAFAAATASLARSDIAGGAAVAADALGGFSFRRSPLSSNPDPSSKVKQTSLQGASWSTSKSATCHRYHVSSSSFASGARRENSTRATFLGGGGSPFSFLEPARCAFCCSSICIMNSNTSDMSSARRRAASRFACESAKCVASCVAANACHFSSERRSSASRVSGTCSRIRRPAVTSCALGVTISNTSSTARCRSCNTGS
mmetsp:Transcript_15780/g.66500  ORF Transcript_15780/g.66500 Transcript_15780/m.66500 type:complete len:330 (-) Transcript_15780:1100-2089(-)